MDIRSYALLAAAMSARPRNFTNAIIELQRAGFIGSVRPARRARRHSLSAAHLAKRLPELANRARTLGAFASAQRLDYYARKLATAPNPAALRLVAAALADDAAHAAASAHENRSLSALRDVWREAADLAAHARMDRLRGRTLLLAGGNRRTA